jgi:hypothetical protein
MVTATTRLRVFGGGRWAALVDVRLGADGAFVFRFCSLVGGCLGLGRVALRTGWWVGGRVAMQCVVFCCRRRGCVPLPVGLGV